MHLCHNPLLILTLLALSPLTCRLYSLVVLCNSFVTVTRPFMKFGIETTYLHFRFPHSNCYISNTILRVQQIHTGRLHI